MGDIALRGNKLTKGRGPHGHGPKPFLNRPGQAQGTHGGKAKGGRIGKFGGGRTNLLEELGRVEAEPSNPNRRAEISRVHGELNRGYAKGGRAGHAAGSIIKKVIQGGKKIIDKIKTGKSNKFDTWETIGIPGSPGPHKGKYPAIDKVMKNIEKQKKKGIKEPGYDPDFKAKGGRIGKAEGGGLTRRKWMNPLEQMGGSPKGKPHSTKEGRIASGTRRLQRMKQKAMNDYHDQMWAGKDAEKGKPHSSPEGRIATGRRNFKRFLQKRVGAKKGGKADKKWMQKVSASIKKRGTKGKCTPITKPGCTGRAKALAKTFKKIAAKRKS